MEMKLREEYCEEINRRLKQGWKIKADELCGIGRYTEWLERKLVSQAIEMKAIERAVGRCMKLSMGIISGIVKE